MTQKEKHRIRNLVCAIQGYMDMIEEGKLPQNLLISKGRKALNNLNLMTQGTPMKIYEAYAIHYDTDGRHIRKLPPKVTFQAESLQEAKLRGADAISDKTGWCVSAFRVRRIYAHAICPQCENAVSIKTLKALRQCLHCKVDYPFRKS